MKKLIYSVLVLFCSISAGAQTMNVTNKTIADENADLHYTMTATYPQLDFGEEALMGVRGIARDINNSIDTMVNGIIQKFTGDVSQMSRKTMNGNGSTLQITGQGWISNGSLFSAEINEFNNIAGMAHPLTTIYTFNATAEGAGPLMLSSLFKANADYLNFISDYCTKELKANAEKKGYINNDMIMTGAAPVQQNFNMWVIVNDNLKIIFNPSQVAPYVFGIQTVSIPLSSMTYMLDPAGPLNFMFR